MKILYITPAMLPSKSANGVHVAKMAQAMGRDGHEVFLYFGRSKDCRDESSFRSYYGVENNFRLIASQKAPALSRLLFIIFLIKHLFSVQPDLVFSRCVPSALVACALGWNTLLEIHDSPSSLGTFSRFSFFLIRFMPSLNKIIVISTPLKRHLIERYNLPDAKVDVFADGADAQVSVPEIPSAFVHDEHYTTNIGYTGHLYKGRGIDLILTVASHLPECLFHIVGGTREDVQYWKGQTDLKNVHFYGHVPPQDVPGFISGFDIVLAPYQKTVAVAGNKGNTVNWMSPLKVFEYMASGKPMICSDLPVLHEVLRNKQNALLCGPDKVTDWVEAIRYLIDHPQEASILAAQAKADLEERYTWQVRARAILSKINVN